VEVYIYTLHISSIGHCAVFVSLPSSWTPAPPCNRVGARKYGTSIIIIAQFYVALVYKVDYSYTSSLSLVSYISSSILISSKPRRNCIIIWRYGNTSPLIRHTAELVASKWHQSALQFQIRALRSQATQTAFCRTRFTNNLQEMKETCTSFALVGCVLLAVSCHLVAQTCGHTIIGTRSAHERNQEYRRLRDALQLYGHSPLKIYINQLESSAKCPFKVLRAHGFIRVICDFTSCPSQKYGLCHSDCQQVYMSTTVLRPIKSRMKLGAYEEVEMGCIYTPRQSMHSVETTNRGPYV
jgi:hypothetical protein